MYCISYFASNQDSISYLYFVVFLSLLWISDKKKPQRCLYQLYKFVVSISNNKPNMSFKSQLLKDAH